MGIFLYLGLTSIYFTYREVMEILLYLQGSYGNFTLLRGKRLENYFTTGSQETFLRKNIVLQSLLVHTVPLEYRIEYELFVAWQENVRSKSCWDELSSSIKFSCFLCFLHALKRNRNYVYKVEFRGTKYHINLNIRKALV